MKSFRLARGFSLIELLAVVAILALLIALLMPTVNMAIFRSQDAKSVSNLRKVGQFLHTYASEQNGNFPSRIETITLPNGSLMSGAAWHVRLDIDGHVDSRNAFFNPKEKYGTWSEWISDPSVPTSQKTFTQAWLPIYGMRLRGAGHDPENLKRIQQPSKFFLVVESWAVGNALPGYFVSADPAWRVKIDKKGTANTLFADGHVEAKDAAYFTNLVNTPVEETGGGVYRVWQAP